MKPIPSTLRRVRFTSPDGVVKETEQFDLHGGLRTAAIRTLNQTTFAWGKKETGAQAYDRALREGWKIEDVTIPESGPV